MSELSCGTRFIGRNETLDLSLYPLAALTVGRRRTQCAAAARCAQHASAVSSASAQGGSGVKHETRMCLKSEENRQLLLASRFVQRTDAESPNIILTVT